MKRTIRFHFTIFDEALTAPNSFLQESKNL